MSIKDDETLVRSFVHPFMNTMTYCSSQEKATKKPPPSGDQHKGSSQSEADVANAPDDAKPEREPSGAQHDVEVRLHFCTRKLRLWLTFYSQDMKGHYRTKSIFRVRSQYLPGCVAAARAIAVKHVERPTSTTIPISTIHTSMVCCQPF